MQYFSIKLYIFYKVILKFPILYIFLVHVVSTLCLFPQYFNGNVADDKQRALIKTLIS